MVIDSVRIIPEQFSVFLLVLLADFESSRISICEIVLLVRLKQRLLCRCVNTRSFMPLFILFLSVEPLDASVSDKIIEGLLKRELY
uniref:Uncharacterized protein n=1 Tax=Paramormyrops kingsleyae TaxID=1676925 RepID=A0A3B3T240_9TELE